MNDTPEQSEKPQDEAQPALTCKPFSAERLSMQIAADRAFRWALGILLVVFIVAGSSVTGGGTGLMFFMLLLGAGWIWMSVSGAKAAQMLAIVTATLEHDPARAESLIAQAVRRWPLPRPLRLLLYHRLAALRHRQGRLAECAAICDALLTYPLGLADPSTAFRLGTPRISPVTGPLGAAEGTPAASAPAIGSVRSHLLLMLVECRLGLNDLPAAHAALMQLHEGQLGLLETLQRLGLQTRYEIAAGYDALALNRLAEKLQLAEIMPAGACAAFHAQLIAPAQRLGRTDLAMWLRQRAELLGAAV